MNAIEDQHLRLPFGVTVVKANRASTADGSLRLPSCCVVQEDVLTIAVEGIGTYALMWTPTEPPPGDVGYTAADGLLADDGIPEALALATGFVLSEGIIDRLTDIAAMWICGERPDVVNIRLLRPEAVAVTRRNVVVKSSCGVCGGREQLLGAVCAVPASRDGLRLRVGDLARIRSEMQAQQRVFAGTGGTHGAVLFDRDLKPISVAEDLGRHNALDKVIGRRLLAGHGFEGCGAFISSRVSYEMTVKAVRAGLALLAAISAPSSMAIELAQRHGLTLCGFVRDDRAMIYSHPERLTE